MPPVSLTDLLQNNLPQGYTGSRGESGFTGSQGVGFTGSTGFTGSMGPQGISVRVIGTVDLIAELPSDGTSDGSTLLIAGDSFIVEEDGNLYIWNGSTWVESGRIQGFTGSVGYTGSQGVQGELGYTGSQGGIGYAGSASTAPGYTGSRGFTGSLGNFTATQDIDEYSSSTYALQANDVGKVLTFSNATSTTVNIQPDLSLAWNVGQRVDIIQWGEGYIQVSASPGVTLLSNNETPILNQKYNTGTLIKSDDNEWLFVTASAGTGPTGFTGSQGIQGEIGYTGSLGGFDSRQDIAEQTSNYTPTIDDAGKLIKLDSTNGSITVTIPPSSSVNFDIGQRIDIIQEGENGVTVTAGTGVTLRSRSNTTSLEGEYAASTIIKIGTDEWIMVVPSAGTTGFTGSTGYTGSLGDTGFTGSLGGFDSIQLIATKTADYTLQLPDAGSLLRFDNTTAVTVTIPNDSNVNFASGNRIDIVQMGVGGVIVSGEAGVTVDALAGINGLNNQYSTGTIVKYAANSWHFIGGSSEGYTGSQGDIGYTGSQGVQGPAGGYTGSQGDSGDIGYTGSQGDIGYTGSEGPQGIPGEAAAVGFTGSLGFTGSAGLVILERHYNYPRTLTVSSGSTKRWWVQSNQLITQIRSQLVTAPEGSAAVIDVKRNGTSIQEITIPSGTNSVELNTNITINDGDYITVDILSVGLNTSGSDLVVSFLYQRT